MAWTQLKIHEQRDKILMPLKPFLPRIGNRPQNPKITHNMVLVTRRSTSKWPKRAPRQMGHSKCVIYHRSKKKRKQDQESGLITTKTENSLLMSTQNHTKKRDTILRYKFSTNIMDSIRNGNFKTLLPFQWHKIDTLHERSHYQVDWDDIKTATKNLPHNSSDGR